MARFPLAGKNSGEINCPKAGNRREHEFCLLPAVTLSQGEKMPGEPGGYTASPSLGDCSSRALLSFQERLKSQSSLSERYGPTASFLSYRLLGSSRGTLTSLVIRSLKESTCRREKATVQSQAQKTGPGASQAQAQLQPEPQITPGTALVLTGNIRELEEPIRSERQVPELPARLPAQAGPQGRSRRVREDTERWGDTENGAAPARAGRGTGRGKDPLCLGRRPPFAREPLGGGRRAAPAPSPPSR